MKKEALAVREARRLGITVIGLVDTNCDPDDADFIIPGNDDAIRSTGLIVRVLADAVAEGQAKVRAAEIGGPRRHAARSRRQRCGRGRGSRCGRRQRPRLRRAPQRRAARPPRQAEPVAVAAEQETTSSEDARE